MPREHLQVDLFDPQDLQAKLPEARRIYGAKRKQLDTLTAQVQRLGQLVELLTELAADVESEPSNGRSGDASRGAPAQERVIAALEMVGSPIGPAALYQFMQEHDMELPATTNALNSNLWAAAKAGRVKRVDEGLYAPLSWEPPTVPATDYATSAEYGMPVPAQLPERAERDSQQTSPNGANRAGETREIGPELGSQEGPG